MVALVIYSCYSQANLGCISSKVDQMNRTVFVIGLSLVLALILTKSRIIEAIFLLVTMGIVPGTSYTIPPTLMLGFFAAATLALSYWILMPRSDMNQEQSRQSSKSLPKRRYRPLKSATR